MTAVAITMATTPCPSLLFAPCIAPPLARFAVGQRRRHQADRSWRRAFPQLAQMIQLEVVDTVDAHQFGFLGCDEIALRVYRRVVGFELLLQPRRQLTAAVELGFLLQ